MTTIRLKYRPSAVSGKEGTLYYQIIHQRIVKRIATKYHIYAHEWDHANNQIIIAGEEPRTTHLQQIANDTQWHISRFRALAQSHDTDPLPLESLIQTLTPATTEDNGVFDFIRREADRLANAGRIRSSETMFATLRSFMLFREHIDLGFNRFDKDLLLQYEGWLHRRRVTRNTSSFYMRNLRVAYQAAIDAGITTDTQPFRKVYTGVDKTSKRALTKDQISRILTLKLSDKPHLEFARDMFMFSFYMRGIPFVDMAYLRKSDLNFGYIVYRRKKTGQQLTIKWTEEMQNITDKYTNNTSYLLPIIMREDDTERLQYQNQLSRINHNLKTIGKLASLPMPLSTYMARHSWATIARDMNVPIAVISQGLGHDNEKTTQIYLDSIEHSVIDDANRLIIDSLTINS